MAPQRKRASNASTVSAAGHTPKHTHLVPTKLRSPPKSVRRSPTKVSGGITQSQKEALIHNLQLDITFKARGLRAQAMFEAAQLRSNLEQRIQRIPMSIRKANMGDLFERYSGRQAAQPRPPVVYPDLEAPVPAPRGLKRSSEDAHILSDKENPVNNPKKRVRTIKGPTAPTSTAQVLSPRSNNARPLPTIAASPSKLPSPAKATLSRPLSPVKPTAPSRSKAPVSSTATGTIKRKPTTTATSTTKPSSRTTSKQTEPTGSLRTKRAAPAPTTLAPILSSTSTTSTGRPRRSAASDRSSSSNATIITKATKPTKPRKQPATIGPSTSRPATTAATRKVTATAPATIGPGGVSGLASANAAANANAGARFAGVPAKGKRVAAAVGKMEERVASSTGTGTARRTLRKRVV